MYKEGGRGWKGLELSLDWERNVNRPVRLVLNLGTHTVSSIVPGPEELLKRISVCLFLNIQFIP